MRNIFPRLFVFGLAIWLLAQAPILIQVFVNLFQVVGLYIIKYIQIEPIGFAVGFILIFGLAREGKK